MIAKNKFRNILDYNSSNIRDIKFSRKNTSHLIRLIEIKKYDDIKLLGMIYITVSWVRRYMSMDIFLDNVEPRDGEEDPGDL